MSQNIYMDYDVVVVRRRKQLRIINYGIYKKKKIFNQFRSPFYIYFLANIFVGIAEFFASCSWRTTWNKRNGSHSVAIKPKWKIGEKKKGNKVRKEKEEDEKKYNNNTETKLKWTHTE